MQVLPLLCVLLLSAAETSIIAGHGAAARLPEPALLQAPAPATMGALPPGRVPAPSPTGHPSHDDAPPPEEKPPTGAPLRARAPAPSLKKPAMEARLPSLVRAPAPSPSRNLHLVPPPPHKPRKYPPNTA
ncbi:hypothetical protein ACP70R_028996 [Stipagrostis hirtigluma subsp. patula]